MRLIKNTFYNILLSLISFFCGIILSIILARKLLPEGMGTYSYYMWLLSIGVTFSSLGIPNTLTKYIAQYFKFSKNYIVLLVRELFKYQVFLFVTTCLIVIIGLRHSPVIVLVYIVGLIFNIANSWLRSYFAGLHKFFEISISSSFIVILEVVIVFILLSFFNKWWIAFVVHIVTVMLNSAILLFLIKDDFKSFRPANNENIQIDRIKITEYFILISLMLIADTIVWQKSEVFFLKIYSSMKDVAFYSIAFSLAYLPLRFITTPIGNVLMPYISTLYGKEELDNSKLTCYHTMRYIIVILLPVIVFCFIFSDKIVELLYGINYIKSASVLRILLISAFVGGVAVPMSALVQALEMMRFAVSVNLFVGVVNIILDLLLIPKYVVTGAAVANTVSQVLGCVIAFTWLYQKLKVKYPLKNLFFASLTIIPLGYVASFFVPKNFFELIVTFIIFFVMYFAVILLTKQVKTKELVEILIKWKQRY